MKEARKSVTLIFPKFVIYALILVCVSLSGCSGTEYDLIPDAKYSQSMLAFMNAHAIEYIQKSYFEVKLLNVYVIEKDSMRFFFYDLLIEPRTTAKFDMISIMLEPDYEVNPTLHSYFDTKSSWQTYSIKPKSAIFNSLWNINYKELFPNEFGALKVQSFLSDGGDSSLSNAGLSKDILKISLQQLTVTIRTDFTKETFHFNARNKLIELTTDEASSLDHLPIKGFLENNLTVKYSTFTGEGE